MRAIVIRPCGAFIVSDSVRQLADPAEFDAGKQQATIVLTGGVLMAHSSSGLPDSGIVTTTGSLTGCDGVPETYSELGSPGTITTSQVPGGAPGAPVDAVSVIGENAPSLIGELTMIRSFSRDLNSVRPRESGSRPLSRPDLMPPEAMPFPQHIRDCGGSLIHDSLPEF